MSNDENGNATEKGEKDNSPSQGNQPQDKSGFIPKARFDEVNAKRKVAEEALAIVAELMADEVPEDMRDMVPDLPPMERVKWIRQAMQRGLFSKPIPNGPDSKRPGGKPPTDFLNMSPAQMRAQGYKS